MHPHSISPNIPIQGMQQQPQQQQQTQFDILNYLPTVSPLQNANILNQPQQQQFIQPQTQATQHQFNIPNTTMVNVAVNFMNNNPNNNNNNINSIQPLHQSEQRNIEDILTNNNLTNMNQLDGMANAGNALDNENNSMNISSLLDLDSQQQINSSNLLLSNDMLNDLIKNLDNGAMDTNENQGAIPITINAIETNNLDADEENMTDSFKKISFEWCHSCYYYSYVLLDLIKQTNKLPIKKKVLLHTIFDKKNKVFVSFRCVFIRLPN